jgi:cytoskeleton protein RodZ
MCFTVPCLEFFAQRVYSICRVNAMDETETLGKHLRRERELRKISLRELSKNTRVREHLLKAIEEDRHDLLPSPTFVKGFLNAYAKYIGLDANEIILRYQRGLTGPQESGPDVTPEKEIGKNAKHRWVVGGSIVGGAIVVGLIVSYFFFLQPSGPRVEPLPVPPAEKAAEKESQEPPPASPQIEEAPSPQKAVPPAPPQIVGTNQTQKGILATPTPTPAPAPSIGTNLPQKGKMISLQLKAVELTWMSVKTDNQTEREIMLRPGEAIPLEAVNQIYILVGNAGGLDLIRNGKSLERFGKSGEVVALTFTPEGLDVKHVETSKP